MKILNIFADKLDLSPQEHRDIKTWIVDLDTQRKQVDTITNVGGGGPNISTGNVEIDFASGITLKNPTTGKRSIYLDPDGDAWFGQDVDTPATNTLFIVSNTQKYDGENYGEGDLLIGSHQSGKANLWWDASAGKLYFRDGTTVSGSIGGGNIVFEAGTIGGWEISSSKLQRNNGNAFIALHSTTGPNPYIELNDGSANQIYLNPGSIYSGNFSSDASGFIIYANSGNAEFNDIVARGAFRASVFEYEETSAIGGSLWVSKNASTLASDFTTTTSPDTGLTIVINDTQSGNSIAAVDDVLEGKTFTGSAVNAFRCTVTAVGAQSGGATTYTVDFDSGTDTVTHTKGAAVVNIGPANYGAIDIQGGDPTRIRMWTHDGTGSGIYTNRVVLGNMNGTYNTGDNDRYGIGIGDYSSGNYLSYNAETADEFTISAGDGNLLLDSSGLALNVGTLNQWEDVHGIRWDDTTPTRIAEIHAYKVSTQNYLGMKLTAPSTTRDTKIEIKATGNTTNDTEISLSISGASKTASVSIEGIYGGSGRVVLDASDTVDVLAEFHAQGDAHIGYPSGGGITVGSGVGTINPADGQIFASGTITTQGMTNPSAGAGVEIGYNTGSAYGRVLAYDRSGSSYKELRLTGSKLTFQEGATDIVYVDNGDFYSENWASWSPTRVGWSSYTESNFYYKRVGDLVFCRVRIAGTSNSTTTTFTLPHGTVNSGNNLVQTLVTEDAGGRDIGYISIPQGSSTATVSTNAAGDAWGSSGNKKFWGQFFYERA